MPPAIGEALCPPMAFINTYNKKNDFRPYGKCQFLITPEEELH